MVFVHRSNIVVSMETAAGNLDVGAEVILNENGAPVNYLIVNQGIPENSPLYDASCDGTWLLRKDIRENGVWNASGVNTLPGSTIMTTMAGYVDDYDPKVQEAIKTVKIPYCVGNGSATVNSGSNGLECKVFPLGGYELGYRISDNTFPIDGSKIDYFNSGTDNTANNKRISMLSGVASDWFTRSQSTASGTTANVWRIRSSGGASSNTPSNTLYGVRPTLILPYDFKFTDAEVVA